MIHAQPSPVFKVGDSVCVRDAGEEWRLGTVTDVDGPKVRPDDWRRSAPGCAWDEQGCRLGGILVCPPSGRFLSGAGGAPGRPELSESHRLTEHRKVR
eukprot:gene15940-biopygen13111